MSNAVKVEGLSKKYVISHKRDGRYSTLRDTISSGTKTLGQAVLETLRGRKSLFRGDEHEEFWALRDVDFEINTGERVGIIGRNGAGKSTLLKILSRITEPTRGRVTLHGRVASLLEVGTGFHPELTGRENIFLNGAILGMGRNEIRQKFDEIVAFAEIDRFLDTPVKRYSSGMYVRLAFSVAAHLEPDILIVDEVLAVGDFQFQKKCLGRMSKLSESGRTVLFVSHNMSAIRRLSDRVVMLSESRVIRDGDPEEVVRHYLASGSVEASGVVFDLDPAEQIGQVCSVTLIDERNNNTGILDVEKPHWVEIEYIVHCDLPDHRVYIVVSSDNGEHLFTSTSADCATEANPVKHGRYRTRVELPAVFLNSGRYLLGVGIGQPKVRSIDFRENALNFQVEGYPFAIQEARRGYFCGKLSWELEKIQSGNLE